MHGDGSVTVVICKHNCSCVLGTNTDEVLYTESYDRQECALSEEEREEKLPKANR